jgi:hypothetical protein
MKNEDFVAAYGDYAARLDVALRVGGNEDIADAANGLATLLGVRYLSCVNRRRTLDVEFIAARNARIGYEKLAEMACEIDDAEDARVFDALVRAREAGE